MMQTWLTSSGNLEGPGLKLIIFLLFDILMTVCTRQSKTTIYENKNKKIVINN